MSNELTVKTPATRTSRPVIPDIEAMRTHDNTMMGAHAYCSRLYAIQHVENKNPIGTKPALSFGKLLHVSLQAGYDALINGADHLDASLSAIYDANFEDPMSDFRTRGRAFVTMTEYWETWGKDQEWEILMTETPFEVMGPDGFRWGGIIDLIVRNILDGRIWAVDHKSTTRFGAYYFDDYKRAPQMIGYTWAGSELQGEELAGVQINVLALRKNDNRFERRGMYYPDWMIEEWKAKTIQDYQQIYAKLSAHEKKKATSEGLLIPALYDETIWTPNLHNCIGKFGKCAAYDLCDTRPDLRERVLQTHFEDRKWDWANIDD